MMEAYVDAIKLFPDTRKAAIKALVNRLAPSREHWWQFWRASEDHRYRLAFELVTFWTHCRG